MITDRREKLYFDIWRKANFRDLLRAYVWLYSSTPKKALPGRMGDALDRCMPDGRGTYTESNWHSAYTISIELAVFMGTPLDHQRYNLTALAEDLLESQITSAQYMTNCMLHFNQRIADAVVNPLYEVLGLFSVDHKAITADDVIEISKFRLNQDGISEASRKQMANILLNRLSETVIFRFNDRRQLELLPQYQQDELAKACKVWGRTADDFTALGYDGYANLISAKNPLVYDGRRLI